MAKKQKRKQPSQKTQNAALRTTCWFCDHDVTPDYKDPKTLGYFLTPRGRVLPRHITSVCASCQRGLAVQIKRARQLALIR
ncbi:30S ribosomal protein S18 [bacterium]|uniref:Small ribosomal subunit protein bS18 n=2 Tax=Katanobacteria TaxID=422282 RepID=A0A2M7X2U5_UNCKA|nr:30S ribosomal protein S18 [bacterium]PIP56937.1 MAG: 30S ribosomal protein S18 [candidate division WWE3 bacterium CG22_combo_CG10-13_8_21_14_all_39_12]PJA40502.1 MAG: 30S ribosomal protein S18 [candidate division WWE3 bacterium CG_4_9_14_3_um_filter_39_7]